MRLITQQVRRSVIGYGSACAAVLVPAVLLAVSPAALAQTTDDAPVAQLAVASVPNAAPDVVPATTAALVPATLDESAQAAAGGTNDGDDANATTASASPAADPVASGDDGAFAGIGTLDDQTLSRQRGGAVGMVMVAATQQLMRGNNTGVTLWDEIAPPAPLPIPVDASQSAQGNVASYTRK
jgi:hypothetical protein